MDLITWVNKMIVVNSPSIIALTWFSNHRLFVLFFICFTSVSFMLLCHHSFFVKYLSQKLINITYMIVIMHLLFMVAELRPSVSTLHLLLVMEQHIT